MRVKYEEEATDDVLKVLKDRMTGTTPTIDKNGGYSWPIKCPHCDFAMTVALPRARWEELGVRLPGGRPLPASTPPASLVSGTTRHFLVYHNYDALLEYNCANSYAISVALLGNAVMSPESKAPPANVKRAKK